MNTNQNTKFKWGIVGSGFIATKFANDLLFTDDHIISAVSSRSPITGKDFAEKYKCELYSSHKDIINHDIDAVYIATDTSLHAELSAYFISMNIPVLCEKPFATNLEDAEMLIRLAKEKNVLFMEAMWTQHLPIYKSIMSDIENGLIGDVVSLDLSYGKHFVKDGAFRMFNKDMGGGSLYDMGVYSSAIISKLKNNVSFKVNAFGVMNEFGTDDTTSALLMFEDKAIASMSSSIVSSLKNIAVISGSKGKIVTGSPLYVPQEYTAYSNSGNIIGGKQISYKGSGLREQAIHFKDLIESSQTDSKTYGHKEMLFSMKILQSISDCVGINK